MRVVDEDGEVLAGRDRFHSSGNRWRRRQRCRRFRKLHAHAAGQREREHRVAHVEEAGQRHAGLDAVDREPGTGRIPAQVLRTKTAEPGRGIDPDP